MNKVKRRPPGTVHAIDLVPAIEQGVWFQVENSAVSHVVNDNGQPEIVIEVSGQKLKVGLQRFYVEPTSPWISTKWSMERIIEGVVIRTQEWLDA